MKTLKNLLPALVMLLCFNYVSAQEMTAKKHDDVKWYVVRQIKFEDGKMEAAKKIINEYFKPADADIGGDGPVLELDLLFSEWDLMVVFSMDEGIETLEWEMTPTDVEWYKAFQKRAGSADKAKQIEEEFESYIKDSKTTLARKLGAK